MARTLGLVGPLLIAGCGGTTPAKTIAPGGGDAVAIAVEPEPPGDPDDATAPPPVTPPLDPIAARLLSAHNRSRAEHCAPALSWSTALADEAAAWARALAANHCGFAHSSSPHGENLAAGTAGALDPDSVVAMWVDEVGAYDFRRPGFGMDTGHFTQVVWQGTTAVGCGTATCNGLSLWVCNYDPPGNVEGDFPANVVAAGCR